MNDRQPIGHPHSFIIKKRISIAWLPWRNEGLIDDVYSQLYNIHLNCRCNELAIFILLFFSNEFPPVFCRLLSRIWKISFSFFFSLLICFVCVYIFKGVLLVVDDNNRERTLEHELWPFKQQPRERERERERKVKWIRVMGIESLSKESFSLSLWLL
jgi:hypothetical protein